MIVREPRSTWIHCRLSFRRADQAPMYLPRLAMYRRALLGPWKRSHLEEALNALFGIEPSSIPTGTLLRAEERRKHDQ